MTYLAPQDIRHIREALLPDFHEIGERISVVESKVDHLTDSMDSFTHIVRRHEQEWLVLRAQHVKMRDVLVKKGVATEDELSVS